MTDIVSTPSGLIHCEEVKAATLLGWLDVRRPKTGEGGGGILWPRSRFRHGWWRWICIASWILCLKEFFSLHKILVSSREKQLPVFDVFTEC